MSRLGIAIRIGEPTRRAVRRRTRTRTNWVIACSLAGSLVFAMLAGGDLRASVDRAFGAAIPADLVLPAPDDALALVTEPSLRPIEASFANDLDVCIARETGGGHFRKVAGRAEFAVRPPVAPVSADLLEVRIVGCMAERSPGKFCSFAYRARFVDLARSSVARARLPQNADIAALVHGSLGPLMREGVVRPWDFRDWRGLGALPHAIAVMAEAWDVPRRPC